MSKIAIMTDSNSGITQSAAKELGITVIPMPFYINNETYYEDINLSQEEFYEKLKDDSVSISTSMPELGTLEKKWKELLKEYDEIVYIPMSSGLSSSCETATLFAESDFPGKVFVVNNQRISVTQKESVLDAMVMAENGYSGQEIKDYLEKTKFDSVIYITVDTLKYLKRGGRVTPAVALIGEVLRIKPVLQILGEKLDSFAKARTYKIAKKDMLNAIAADIDQRFGLKGQEDKVIISIAYTTSLDEALEWKKEVQDVYPNHKIIMDPLSLSVACHIGPGALAVTCGIKTSEEILNRKEK